MSGLFLIKRIIIYWFFLCTFALFPYDKITVLTYPIENYSSDSWHHAGVTNSLLRGFQNLQINFNYNPRSVHEIGSTVIVLTNIDALHEAIELKKRGRIKKLLAGPNLVVLPRDHNAILLDPAIDMCIVPSKWVKTAYLEEAPSLKGRIGVWPAGIDMHFWNPACTLDNKETKDVVVYWKTENEEFCKNIEYLLQQHGWNPKRIKYGEYSPQSYKQLLEKSKFAVFISRTESQSLALLEAWAMDVPTLVWNPQPLDTHGRIYSTISACPYLTKYTGEQWRTLEEFKTLLNDIPHKIINFKPAHWVNKYMSDTIATKRLLMLIESIQN